MSDSTWIWLGGTGQATISANWTLAAGSSNAFGYPQADDTAINAGGMVLTALDTQFSGDTIELGGTAEVAALSIVGDSGMDLSNPTFTGTTVLSSAVPGNTTAETSVIDAAGTFVNQGTIIADGPAGSSFTIAITGTTLGGTFEPGYAYNPGLIEADAGNTLTISVGASSELFNTGSIVADGGTVVIEAAASAIAGGYAPVRGFAVIEGGGTLETNSAYAPTVSGTTPYFEFGDTTPGNTLKIDNIGSFGGDIAGFAAGDTIDLGASLAVGTLVYDSASSLLSLENGAGTILASLLMGGPFASGTYVVNDGTAGSFAIGTGSDGDAVLTTSMTDPIASGTAGTWQASTSWLNGTVPGATGTPRIGQGASSNFTLTTGTSPVSVASFAITAPQATVQITSDTTATAGSVSDYSGTLDVTAGNTLTAEDLQAYDPSAAVTIAAGATVDLTGALERPLAPVAGIWTVDTGDQLAVRFSAGTAEIDGALLAGTPSSAGGGGSVAIGWDSDGSADVTVNSGGTVTDTYTFLGSDPTSSGTLTLNGPGASWTDMTVPADTDPEDTRGDIQVGYNDASTNTPAGLTAPAPVAAAQLLIENGATLTDQARAYVAYTPDSAGSVTVTSGGLWNVGYTTGGILEVGDEAQGALTISNDGTVEVGANVGYFSGGVTQTAEGLDIGRVAGSSGTVTVESGGVLRDAGGINAGESGQGTLDVLNGGTVDLSTTDGFSVVVGESADGTGTILVSGTASVLISGTAAGGMDIGEGGQGLLEVENGGTVAFDGSGNHINIAQTAGASGTVVVSGASSLLTLGTATAGLRVGEVSQGLFEVENGGTVSVASVGGIVSVGSVAGASGTIVVSGTGALLALGTATASMQVGLEGQGVLDVENGGTVDMAAGPIELGAYPDASGTVTVSGSGSAIIDQGSGAGVDVGIQGGATAVVSVQDGGSLATSGSVDLGPDSSSATLTVSGTGSNLTAQGGIFVGQAYANTTTALLDVQNQGTVDTTNLSIGGGAGLFAATGDASVAVSAGGEVEVTAGISVWIGSTLSVDGASSVDIGTTGSAVAGNVLIESGRSLVGSGLVAASIVNQGSLESQSEPTQETVFGPIGLTGTLEVAGSIGGTGSIILEQSSFLRLDGSVASGQTIDFATGGAETLILNTTPGTISSPIAGLNFEDAIEFGGIAQITTAGVTSPGVITVQTTAGTYVLNDVSFAAGVSPVISWGTDATTGYQDIRVVPQTLDWTGDSSTDLATAGNWNASEVPDANDSLVFSAGGGGALSGTATALVATVSGTGAWVLQGATLSLAGEQQFEGQPLVLSDSGGLTINGGSLTGSGTALIGSAQSATMVAQDGAQVSFQQTDIGNGGSGTLLVTGSATTWRSTDMSIGVGSSGDLTITNDASAIDSGADSIDDGDATVSAGGSLQDDGLFIDSLGMLTVNDGTVSATGGDVSLDGTLTVENGGIVMASGLAVDDGTMFIGAGSTVTANSVSSSGGTISISGGLLDPAAATSLSSDSMLAGFGTLDSSVSVGSTSTLVAQDGTLQVSGSITGSGTLEVIAGGKLVLNSTVGSSDHIDFLDATGTLVAGDIGGFKGTFAKFAAGDEIIVQTTQAATFDLSGSLVSVMAGPTALGTLTFANASLASFVAGTNGALVDQVICFCAGTMIATPAGDAPVERLSVGDQVLTLRGPARPIVWIGAGRVLATRGRRNAATPVIVRKGAFGDNVPHHDLRVTKGHSFYLDGVLIPVEFLVNHRSILWDDRAQEVMIYHIELATHDVLLANGAPAESYRDDGNRWLFQNANSGWDLPPQSPCAPVLTGGPAVDAVWRRLLERAGPRKRLPLTDDPDLHLQVDGKRIDAIERRNDMHVFRLDTRPRSVRICSRVAAPQELGIARDERALGVAVRRIALAQPRRKRAIEADAASLTDGYHAFEPDNGVRWTDGDAAVPADLFADMSGPGMLLLHLGGTTQYLDDGTAVRAA